MNFEKLRDFAIFSIPIFTVCSAIYQLAYWGTFDINGLAMISAADIIKCSVYPFFNGSFLFIIIYLIAQIAFRNEDVTIKKLTPNDFFWSGTLIISILITIYSFPILQKHLSSPLTLEGIGFALIALGEKIINSINYIRILIPNAKIRLIAIDIMLYIIIFSFLQGKINSYLIRDNITYSYIKIKDESLTDTTGFLKIIDFADSKLFLTDYSNSRVIRMDASNLDSLVIYHKK